MPILRAGLAVAAMLIGGIAAFLGIIMLLSSLNSGSISMSYGTGDAAVSEVVTRAADAARYWKMIIGLGVLPLALGVAASMWGWRQIR